jgi:hypothetical protein
MEEELHDRLAQADVTPVRLRPTGVEIVLTIRPGRNSAAPWKSLIDALGPVLGEDPLRPFHSRDDRIVSLGLHHHVTGDIGHDVIINAWWASQ